MKYYKHSVGQLWYEITSFSDILLFLLIFCYFKHAQAIYPCTVLSNKFLVQLDWKFVTLA